MARSFAANPSGAFTVQFELVCQPASLTRAVREGGANVWFVPISYRGQGCYRVFWGHYASQEEAKRATAELPAALGASAPAVVHVPR
jgi:septal ring-binding cell division protein DamX